MKNIFKNGGRQLPLLFVGFHAHAARSPLSQSIVRTGLDMSGSNSGFKLSQEAICFSIHPTGKFFSFSHFAEQFQLKE
jgi:hypothetical protein